MQNDEQLIRALIDQWHQASRAGDLQQVLALMSEDVVFLRPGQPPMRGKEAFSRGFEMVSQHHRFEPMGDVQDIRIAGNLAYCWSHLSVKMIPLTVGLPIRLDGHTLTVLEKQGAGSWLVIRDANMLVPA